MEFDEMNAMHGQLGQVSSIRCVEILVHLPESVGSTLH
jgi:2,3-bisphosphoglycerate-independent phosphoglycerate mutase